MEETQKRIGFFIRWAEMNHSQSELRWFLLGKTDNKRQLFIVFTVRDKLIRVISARNMSKKERRIYNEKSK